MAIPSISGSASSSAKSDAGLTNNLSFGNAGSSGSIGLSSTTVALIVGAVVLVAAAFFYFRKK